LRIDTGEAKKGKPRTLRYSVADLEEYIRLTRDAHAAEQES
jgi:hypothetical protein